ncbi:MAG: hypothetical protein IKW80_10655 [Thermoguttaceae bacterium]|nr:hypothetical protein [Thermoguttaceae bacterium]MBR5162078.1 hypothetical protein [Thermoguttaceae bacterium]
MRSDIMISIGLECMGKERTSGKDAVLRPAETVLPRTLQPPRLQDENILHDDPIL